MSTKNNKKEVVKVKKNRKPIVDTLVYWLVQIAFAVLASAGVLYYLQPIDIVLSLPLTVLLVGLLFYTSLKNR